MRNWGAAGPRVGFTNCGTNAKGDCNSLSGNVAIFVWRVWRCRPWAPGTFDAAGPVDHALEGRGMATVLAHGSWLAATACYCFV